MKSILRLCLAFFLLLAWSGAARADKFSDSYLTLRVDGNTIHGQWDIALRDLEMAVGLDADGNGEITWNELRARHAAVAAYALSRLTLESDGARCEVRPEAQLVDRHSDGAYDVLRFAGTCPAAVRKLAVRYDLLFDLDPQHKGLLKLVAGTATSTGVFDPAHTAQTFSVAGKSIGETFVEYLTLGIHHIWTGYDHLLFLFSLLLPAVFVSGGRERQPSPSFRNSMVDVLKIVTAFTLAHSVTLTLSTLGVVSLPARWVEAGIAATVIVAALNNVFPIVKERRWVAALVFGLIHGFGFANVLADLGLPKQTLLLALLAFNLGVEVGQFAIVAVFLPIAFSLRETRLYRQGVFVAGSLVIAVIASVWFVERAFDLQLMPI
ncbi:MAG: HupE/UreJ family protein [Burkholderiaceae bacterium]